MVSENILPYKCKDCSAQFKDAQEAINHFKIVHEGKKLFKCTICEVTFASADYLKRHFTSLHEEKRPFKCKMCDKSFSHKRHKERHIVSIHEVIHNGKRLSKCLDFAPDFEDRLGDLAS